MYVIQIPVFVFFGSLFAFFGVLFCLFKAMQWHYQSKVSKIMARLAAMQSPSRPAAGAQALMLRNKRWQWEDQGGDDE